MSISHKHKFVRQVRYSQARPIFLPCSNSVNHPTAVEEGGWNCFHTCSKTMQVIDDEGPWQVVQLIPELAFVPNEDVFYWHTLLWNTFMGWMMILSLSFKPFIESIPRTFLHHNIKLALSLSMSKHCFALKQEGASSLSFVGTKEH